MKLAIVYFLVWIFIAFCFCKAGMMNIKEQEEKCKKCKWKVPCKRAKIRICINNDLGELNNEIK